MELESTNERVYTSNAITRLYNAAVASRKPGRMQSGERINNLAEESENG